MILILFFHRWITRNEFNSCTIYIRYDNKADRTRFLSLSNSNSNFQTIRIPLSDLQWDGESSMGWRIKIQTRPKWIWVGFGYSCLTIIHLMKSILFNRNIYYFQKSNYITNIKIKQFQKNSYINFKYFK